MPPEKKQQNNPLGKLFADLDEHLTSSVKQEELMDIIAGVLKAVSALDERVSQIIAKNKDISDNSVRELGGKNEAEHAKMMRDMEAMRSEHRQNIEIAIKQLMDKVNAVRGEIPSLPDYTGTFTELSEHLAKLDALIIGENVRNSLEALPEGEKLAIEAIEGLRKELNELKKARGGATNGGGIVGRDIVKDYDLSSQLDGVTKTFNIPAVWNIISVHCSSFPHALRKNIDFTYTPQTITFTDQIDASTTLASGQTVVLTIVSG